MESHASANLHFIRTTMESAGTFTSVPGKGGMAMGAVALLAAAATEIPALGKYWLAIWIGAGCVGAAIGSIALVRKTRASGQQLFGVIGRRFLLGLTPSILCAGVLTPFLVRSDSNQLIAGSWLLLYGAGVVAGGAFSIRLVPILGSVFMILGGACLLLPGVSPNLFMALGFGLGHLVFGALIARSHGG